MSRYIIIILVMLSSKSAYAFFGPGFICENHGYNGLNLVRNVSCTELSLSDEKNADCLGIFKFDYETSNFERTSEFRISVGLRCGSMFVSRDGHYVAVLEKHRDWVKSSRAAITIYSSSGELVLSFPITSLLSSEEIKNNVRFGDGVHWFEDAYFDFDSTKFTFFGPTRQVVRSRYRMPRELFQTDKVTEYAYTIDIKTKKVGRFEKD